MDDLSPILQTIIANEPKAIEWTFSVARSEAMFAQRAFDHFATALVSVQPGHMFFEAVYVHARKMAGLGLMSALRQHRVESGQNLRQALEATSLMGYHAFHPGTPQGMGEKDTSSARMFAANEAGLQKAFNWVAVAYPGLSKDLKHYKDHSNRNMSHATILGAGYVYNFAGDPLSGQRFFDVREEDETRMGLYPSGRVTMSALAMLGKIATGAKGVAVQPGFGAAFDELNAMSADVQKGLT
jgi:hypothetical protein